MSKKRTIKKEKAKRKDDVKTRKTNYFLPGLLFFSIALLTLLAYLRSLHGPLVFDDIIYIKPQKLKNILPHLHLHVRSVSQLSFALNYYFWGVNLAVFRLTNIFFHVVSAFLAFYLAYTMLSLPSVRRTYGEFSDKRTPLYIALIAATLFLLHPIQTSPVNYITQRMAIMACMFSLAGFIFYTRGVAGAGLKSALYYVLSGLSFVLAIFSKENAVMVLFMLPVYDLFFLSSFQWREFRRRFIMLSVLMMSLAAVTAYNMHIVKLLGKIAAIYSNPYQPMERYGWAGVDINWTPVEYILTESRIVSRYIFLILLPIPSFMVFDFSNSYAVSKGLFDPATTLFSLAFLASLLFFSLKYMKRAPLISFGILWYLVTISLESFIALGLDPYFEHRNYLPSFGLFLAFASLFLYFKKFDIMAKKEAIISFVAVLLFILTFTRNGVWTRADLLWKDAVEKAPNNARALISLSSEYIKERRFQEAQEYLQRAGKVQPLTDKFRNDILFNQASIYKETNRRGEALAILRDLESDPSLRKDTIGLVRYFLGDMLREERDYAQAMEYLDKAHKSKELRYSPRLLISLGLVSWSLGDKHKAERYFKEAVKMEPAGITPYMELGALYLSKNDLDRAEMNYREALGRGARGDVEKKALFGIAQIKLMKGETDEALRLFRQVIRISPGFYPPYIFIGGIYVKKNDPDSALLYLEKALSFKETFMKNESNTKLLYYYLGKAYLEKGNSKQAKENLDAFLSMAAGDRLLEKLLVRAKEESAQIRKR